MAFDREMLRTMTRRMWDTMRMFISCSSPNIIMIIKRKLNGQDMHTLLGGNLEGKGPLESTQPLTEMSTKNLPGGKGRPEPKAHITTICEQTVGNVGNLMGLRGLLQG
jgi:hypothetical protein